MKFFLFNLHGFRGSQEVPPKKHDGENYSYSKGKGTVVHKCYWRGENILGTYIIGDED